jgi:hypothetical protein
MNKHIKIHYEKDKEEAENCFCFYELFIETGFCGRAVISINWFTIWDN